LRRLLLELLCLVTLSIETVSALPDTHATSRDHSCAEAVLNEGRQLVCT
jgi:hypothetical protein